MSKTTILATIQPVGWRSYRLYYGGRIRIWFKNLWNWRTAWAVRYLSKQLQKDKEFRDAWHANIAMPIYDESAQHLVTHSAGHEFRHRFSNDCADRLMKHLFDA